MDAAHFPAVRWRDSLITRIIALCAVLVACLFGAVYFLTGNYYKQVVTAFQEQAERIAQQAKVTLETIPKEELERELRDHQMIEGVHITITPMVDAQQPAGLRPKVGAEGNVYFEATQFVQLQNGPSFTANFLLPVDPQTEILRAFKNRYLFGLTCVFVITLFMMIYLIVKSLEPLQALTEACAKISEGSMETIDLAEGPGEVRALGATFNRMIVSLREKATVEANLRRAQRLSAVGTLAAGVAHDVRNPLNAIKLLSSQALDEAESSGDLNGSAKALRTIRSEVDRLEDIVSGFLSLAKEEELRKEIQPLDPILEECLNLVQKDAESRGVRITGEFRAHDTQLALDAKKLKRAVLNVLINALEVCPPGGRVRLFSRQTDGACEIEIRDDGPGMTPEALEHAFDPYFTTKPTGTGLGLAITRGIVEEHGGAISLSSTIGQGTQALITLPLHTAAQVEAQRP